MTANISPRTASGNKVAIVTPYPIQYYSPWFKHLAGQEEVRFKVFYLWDFGVAEQRDFGFGESFRWDVPLLEGHDHEFVPNISKTPGLNHFRGLDNPDLFDRVAAYAPDAVLLIGYNHWTYYRFLWQWRVQKAPLILRGDSHRLVRRRGLGEILKRRFISFLFKRFSAFLFVGKANYDYFLYHGASPGQLFYAPHAVDNERFFSEASAAAEPARLWKQDLGIPADHKVVLFAGKLEEKKRPQDLLEAFAKAELEKCSLLFVGSGHLEAELKRRAQTVKNVYFAPFQNQSLMPRTYLAGDLFVLPSYGSGETWGLSVNEAMCVSRPVVVSSHAGCARDLVEPFRNGLIFEAGDVDSLANALKEAFSDTDRLKRWGEEGRRKIEAYSYERATEGLMAALRSLRATDQAALRGKK